MTLTNYQVKVMKTPHKGCPSCRNANPAAVHKCTFCGYVFIRKKDK
ncbi:zinc ribbon domain-containing protein [Serratia marcescens]|nr:hypothetical protein D9B80_15290 [Serratia marcescens]RTF57124.1 hypothetical protein D9B74_11470 [Serratia marcescens]RTF58024.1 hypothetical protein D9B79_09045 [Serratia marcescens]RTF75404.1 hypothetical protein D9B76_02425 [Serratia marcescens]RTF84043.1 hypothetical protein D9B45_11830 [Serratia marcescens]